jgi:hypothetical protein
MEKRIARARSATSKIEVKLRYNYPLHAPVMINIVLVYRAAGYTSRCYAAIKIYILNENLYINPLLYNLHLFSYITVTVNYLVITIALPINVKLI